MNHGLLSGSLNLLLLHWHVWRHGIHVLEVVHIGNTGIVHVHTLILIVAGWLEGLSAHVVHSEGLVEGAVLLLAFEHAVYSVVHLSRNILVQEVDEWVT